MKNVEPLVREEALREEPCCGTFSIPNPDMKVFALSVSSDGEISISSTRTISMLITKSLRWEIASEGLPSALLTEDGRFAVGTDKGTVYFCEGGHILWQSAFEDKIEHIVLTKR